MRPLKILALCYLVLALIGCAQTPVRHKTAHQETREAVSVVLMPIDIELSSLTAGGVKEVRADWTETANDLLSDALERQLADKSDRLIEYVPPDGPLTLQQHQQIMKLHSTIGETIYTYSLAPALTPPTRKGDFEWSLGKDVTSLRETSGADYGLFIYIRDSYATAGRKTLIVAYALLNVNLPGGNQWGFATLVDLRDGSVVWFNRINRPTGDLRTKGPAEVTARELITDIPL